METKPKISFDKFLEIESQLEIRIGLIIAAERVPKSNGLKLTINFGGLENKTSFTNIGKTHEPKDLMGARLAFVTNLEPIEIKGVKSEVMIMVGKAIDGTDDLGSFDEGTTIL